MHNLTNLMNYITPFDNAISVKWCLLECATDRITPLRTNRRDVQTCIRDHHIARCASSSRRGELPGIYASLGNNPPRKGSPVRNPLPSVIR